MAKLIEMSGKTWLFASNSDWEKLTQWVDETQTLPNDAAFELFSLGQVDHKDKKDLVDQNISFFKKEARIYRNRDKESKKDRCVVRKIASQFVFWRNRKGYGLVCEVIVKTNNVGLIRHWSNAPTQYRGEELEQKNGQLIVENIDKWDVQAFTVEYHRISGLGEMLESMTAQLQKLDA